MICSELVEELTLIFSAITVGFKQEYKASVVLLQHDSNYYYPRTRESKLISFREVARSPSSHSGTKLRNGVDLNVITFAFASSMSILARSPIN